MPLRSSETGEKRGSPPPSADEPEQLRGPHQSPHGTRTGGLAERSPRRRSWRRRSWRRRPRWESWESMSPRPRWISPCDPAGTSGAALGHRHRPSQCGWLGRTAAGPAARADRADRADRAGGHGRTGGSSGGGLGHRGAAPRRGHPPPGARREPGQWANGPRPLRSMVRSWLRSWLRSWRTSPQSSTPRLAPCLAPCLMRRRRNWRRPWRVGASSLGCRRPSANGLTRPCRRYRRASGAHPAPPRLAAPRLAARGVGRSRPHAGRARAGQSGVAGTRERGNARTCCGVCRAAVPRRP
jgi:hypothetical protein